MHQAKRRPTSQKTRSAMTCFFSWLRGNSRGSCQLPLQKDGCFGWTCACGPREPSDHWHGRTVKPCNTTKRGGRTWERLALLRARPIAGQRSLGQAFLRKIQPFVAGREERSPQNVIHTVYQLRAEIHQKIQRKGEYERNVQTQSRRNSRRGIPHPDVSIVARDRVSAIVLNRTRSWACTISAP